VILSAIAKAFVIDSMQSSHARQRMFCSRQPKRGSPIRYREKRRPKRPGKRGPAAIIGDAAVALSRFERASGGLRLQHRSWIGGDG
jgi:hypothetical protein